MFKLTILLCATLFVTMVIGGRDFGQLRPGLVATTLPAQTAPANPDTAPPARVTSLPLVLPLAQPVQAPALPAPEITIAEKPAPAPVWYVSASAINVREGPSTAFSVIDKLPLGEAVSVISQGATGWVHIRIEGDGIEGYVSGRYLTPEAPGY